MIKVHHISRYHPIGDKIGTLTPATTLVWASANYNSTASGSSETICVQVHDDLKVIFGQKAPAFKVFRDSNPKSPTGNSYVTAPNDAGMRPTNGDYLTLLAAKTLVHMLECNLPSFGGSLLNQMAGQFTYGVTVGKGLTTKTADKFSFVLVDGGTTSYANVSSVLDQIKQRIAGGATRFDATACADLAKKIRTVIGVKDVTITAGAPALPREILLYVDACNFLRSLCNAAPSSLTTYVQAANDTTIPTQEVANASSFKDLVRKLWFTKYALETVPSLMPLEKILQYDKDNNHFMEQFTSDFSANLLESRWDAYSKIILEADSVQRHLTTRWSAFQNLLDLYVVRSSRSGLPLPDVAAKTIGFFHDAFATPASPVVWTLGYNKLSDADLNEKISNLEKLAEDIIKYVNPVVDACYVENRKPFQGFRLHRDFFMNTGEEYIYRIEPVPPKLLHNIQFEGVNFSDVQLLSFTGSDATLDLERIDLQPKYVELVPSRVVANGRFPLKSTSTDGHWGVSLEGSAASLAAWTALRERVKEYCSFLELAYDELTQETRATVKCEAFAIYPPASGEHVVAFGWSARREVSGTLFQIISVDPASCPVCDLLMAFKSNEVLSCDSNKLRELYLSRIKAIPQDPDPTCNRLFPSLLKREEVDPLAAAIGWTAKSALINNPAGSSVLKTYYTGPGCTASVLAAAKALPLNVQLPNSYVSRHYFVPLSSLNEQVRNDLQDARFNGYVKYGSLRDDGTGNPVPAIEFYTPDAANHANLITVKESHWAKTYGLTYLKVNAHYRDNVSYASRFVRPSKNGSGYSTNLLYQPSIQSALERSRNVVIEDWNGVAGLDSSYFRRFRESVSDHSLSMHPATLGSMYAKNLSLACYEKLLNQTDATEFVDVDIACEQLEDYRRYITSSRFDPSAVVATTFNVVGAECTIDELDKAIAAFSSKKDLTSAKALVAKWGGDLVANVSLLGLAVPIIVDKRCHIMSAYLSGCYQFYESPALVTGLDGSTMTALTTCIMERAHLDYVTGSMIKYISHSLEALL